MGRPKKITNEDVAKAMGYKSVGRGWWTLPNAKPNDPPVKILPEYTKWVDVALAAVNTAGVREEVYDYMIANMDLWNAEEICESLIAVLEAKRG